MVIYDNSLEIYIHIHIYTHTYIYDDCLQENFKIKDEF